MFMGEKFIRILPNQFFEKFHRKTYNEFGNIYVIEDKGKLFWQNSLDFGLRARVENTMHRYKAIIGNKLRSKTFESQTTEINIAVNILNRMMDLGMPKAKLAA